MKRNIGDIFSDIPFQKPKTSQVRYPLLELGILALCCFFVLWIVSFFSFHGIIMWVDIYLLLLLAL